VLHRPGFSLSLVDMMARPGRRETSLFFRSLAFEPGSFRGVSFFDGGAFCGEGGKSGFGVRGVSVGEPGRVNGLRKEESSFLSLSLGGGTVAR
jgi:hypothetical protein